jgi:cysteine synthase
MAAVFLPMPTSPARPRPALLNLIGRTPLLPLQFPAEAATVFAKAEFLNPSGSIKDRFARCVIEDAERSGLLGR